MVPYDGNSAVTHVAHATNEVMTIYPITPSSNMGEEADAKSARGEKNIWGAVPDVAELQSEGGASGAVHGSLSAGSLTTTFTASQGLLLMIPNMHKIAGEMLPSVFHVSARSVACQALSIFGDHSDVMDARATGFGLLSSASIQEAMDFALIAQAASLESKVPFIHFFEGFRISHEIQKIEEVSKDHMVKMIEQKFVDDFHKKAMSPDHPAIRGTSQNPDVFFQGRESVNKYYDDAPAVVQKYMDKFAKLTGRTYKIFEYIGDPKATDVIVCMGCGCETIHETVDHLRKKNKKKVGLLKVRLYRPFDAKALIKALPKSTQRIAVLDRTKEPGSSGEPLFLDVVSAVAESMTEKKPSFKKMPVIIGGRYGLGSKEFTPGMVAGIFDELSKKNPKKRFTVGIEDDITNTSIKYDPEFDIEGDVHTAMFYGLGSDGTVGANKNSIKIIGDNTDNYAQGYFVYDSKKAGAITISHLRFGKKLIRKPYLISKAGFMACHNFSFLEKYDMLKDLKKGGTFLLSSPYGADEVWSKMPKKVQQQIIDKKAKFYVINAIDIAEKVGLGGRINVIMQTAFFKLAKVIDEKLAVDKIKQAIKKTYGAKGDDIVNMNCAAVDRALDKIEEVKVPAKADSKIQMPATVPSSAPKFVRETTARIIRQEGNDVKVSEMPYNGEWPVGTTQYEKRNIAIHVPVWNSETCIQCGQCSLVCPHAAIRPKIYDPKHLEGAPETFKSTDARTPKLAGLKYTLQNAPEDCTGCGVCVDNCPKNEDEAIKMQPQAPLRETERKNWDFFTKIPDPDISKFRINSVKGSQFMRPLFEFSGACAGCGETPYVKLLTQLFGDRLLIANATGCSSIYGGNLPTTPYTSRPDGKGPAWNNSLFEDNAEIAFGMRLSVNNLEKNAMILLEEVASETSDSSLKKLISEIKGLPQSEQAEIEALRAKIEELKTICKKGKKKEKQLALLADYLVKKSVWALGGDGWAYDIGYGGLDHVLASGENVNVLVLDTEVYSNTGGQASKSTPLGAVAKFAASGKPTGKKNLGLMMTTYGNIFVAQTALSNPNHVVKALYEAERYEGPSIVIAYSHCIAHGINMTHGIREQKKAVDTGHFPLFRYNPDLALEGKNPLQLDSKAPTVKMEEFMKGENRYRMLAKADPEKAEGFIKVAQRMADARWQIFSQMAQMSYSAHKGDNGNGNEASSEA